MLKTILKSILYFALFPLLGLWSFVGNVYAQADFEGVVHYRISIEALDDKVKEYDLMQFYGDKAQFSFKKGNYKWDFEQSTIESQTYNHKENKVYDKFFKNDTLYWTNAADEIEDILQENPIKTDTKVKILGKPCQLLTVNTKFIKTGEKRGRMYFFASGYKVSPALLAKHRFNNMNYIYDKMKAVPLQIIVLHKSYRIIYEAYKIDFKPLKDEIFSIPKKAKVKKMK